MITATFTEKLSKSITYLLVNRKEKLMLYFLNSKYYLFQFLFLCLLTVSITPDIQAQPSPIDRIDLSASFDFSEEEMDRYVDDYYDSLAIKESSIVQTIMGLTYGDHYESINLDSIINVLDWDGFVKAVDWNAIFSTVDWDKFITLLCSEYASLGFDPKSQPSDIPDILKSDISPNWMLYINKCNRFDPQSISTLSQFLSCFQRKANTQGATDFCSFAECIDFNNLFAFFDWTCLMRQVDFAKWISYGMQNSFVNELMNLPIRGSDSIIQKKMSAYPLSEMINLDTLNRHLGPASDKLFSPALKKEMLRNFSNHIFVKNKISLDEPASMQLLVELSNKLIPYLITDPQLARYLVVFTNISFETLVLLHQFKYRDAYANFVIIRNLMMHFIHRKLYGNFEGSKQLDLFLNKRSLLSILATLERNMATIAGELGQREAADRLYNSSEGLFKLTIGKESYDYTASDYLGPLLSSESRQKITDRYHLSSTILDLAKIDVLLGKHPAIIDSLLQLQEVGAAVKCYKVLIDLLLQQGKENEVIVNIFPSHPGAHKIYELFYLQAIYRNIAQILEKHHQGVDRTLRDKYTVAPKVLEQFRIRQQETSLLNNLGAYNFYLGDMERAIEYFEEAWKNLKILRNLDYTLLVVPGLGSYDSEFFNKTSVFTNVIKNLAQCYIKIEDYESAHSFLKGAKTYLQELHEEQQASSSMIANKISITSDLLGIDALLADLYRREGKYEKVKQYLLNNKKVAVRTGENLFQLLAFSDLSKFYFEINELDSALVYATSASDIAHQLNYERAQAQMLLSIGIILQHKKNNKVALTYFDSTEVIADKIGEYDVLKALYTYRGMFYLRQEKYTKALTSFEKGIEVIEQDQLLKVRGDRSMQLLIGGGLSNYEGAIQAALALKEYAKVFQYIQTSKSRIFDEFLEKSYLLQRNISPAHRAELNLIQRQIQNAASGGKAKLFRDSLNRELAIIKVAIKRDILNDDYSVVDLEEVQKYLHTDQVFIDFFIGRYNKVAVIITKDSLFYSPLNYRQSTEDELLKINRMIYEVSEDKEITNYEIKKLENRIDEISGQLFEDLLPFFSKLRRGGAVNELIIAPDRELYTVPFEVLLKQYTKDSIIQGSFDNLMINYYQSATAFVKNRQRMQDRPAAKEGLLFVGKSRFDDHKEIDPINGRLYPRLMVKVLDTLFSATEVIMDTDTKLEHVEKTLGGHHRYIYFHTHGLMDAEYPDKNYLALQGGRLYTVNTLDLKLNSEVTVLAACKSGKGKFRRGSGILGFTSAFMAAGSQAVIISLWSPDKRATRILFTQFFKLLKDGKSPKLALQQAKNHLRTVEKGRYKSPLYWAPFVLFGG